MSDNALVTLFVTVFVVCLTVLLISLSWADMAKNNNRNISGLQECQDIAPNGEYAKAGTHWAKICEMGIPRE